MPEKKERIPEIAMTNTKKEMMEAYDALVQKMREREQSTLKPEVQLEKKKEQKAIDTAESLSSEGVVKGVGALRMEFGKILTDLSDRLEQEITRFNEVRQAIAVKEREVQEIYEIEKSAHSFAALIEAQAQRRQQFDSEMTAKKQSLEQEIENTRKEWEEEKKRHQAAIKERDTEEEKNRARVKEEYLYTTKREQKLTQIELADAKTELERELHRRREEAEKDLTERERAVSQCEEELKELRQEAATYPKEMEKAVARARQETAEQCQQEAKRGQELSVKEFDGERNVLKTRIEALEKAVSDQTEQVRRLSQNLEKSHQQVQDIAVKAIESSANVRSSVMRAVAESKQRPEEERETD